MIPSNIDIMILNKNRSAALGFIFVTVLIDVIGFGIIIPVIPSLIQKLTGGDMSVASRYGGFLMFAYAIMQFLFAPVLGNLSDRYGRRTIILISLFGFGIDYLLLAWAPNIVWLFIARIISGITGASFTTASAYIADISTPEKRAQNFGLMGAAFGLGFIIGPLLGGVLGQYGERVPFFFAAGLSLVNWLYGLFILPESLPTDKRRNFDWKRANPVGSLMHLKKYPALTGLILSLTFIYVGAHAVQTTWSYYTIKKFNWNTGMVGYSLAFVGLMVAIVQGGLIRIVIPKLGQARALFIGLMMYTIGMFLFAFASSLWATASYQAGTTEDEILTQDGKPSYFLEGSNRIAIVGTTFGTIADDGTRFGNNDIFLLILNLTTGVWQKYQVGTAANDFGTTVFGIGGDRLVLGGFSDAAFQDPDNGIFCVFDASEGIKGKAS